MTKEQLSKTVRYNGHAVRKIWAVIDGQRKTIDVMDKTINELRDALAKEKASHEQIAREYQSCMGKCLRLETELAHACGEPGPGEWR